MVDTTADTNFALVRAVTAANEALMKQNQFGVEVEHFQRQLMRDLEVSKADTQSYLRTLMRKIESALQNTIRPISDKMKKVETEANNVQTVRRL